MPRWSVKSKHKRRVVLVLPGFNQGRGKRGAWFAWTEKTEDFFGKFSRGWYTVKYDIFSPENEFPLSEGELQHLTEEISSSEQAYASLSQAAAHSTHNFLKMKKRSIGLLARINLFSQML